MQASKLDESKPKNVNNAANRKQTFRLPRNPKIIADVSSFCKVTTTGERDVRFV